MCARDGVYVARRGNQSPWLLEGKLAVDWIAYDLVVTLKHT